MNHNLKEAEVLLEALYDCLDEVENNKTIEQIKEMLSPYITERHPRALWLKARLPNLGEEKNTPNKEFDNLWLSLIKEAADGNCAEAQYRHGCNLYDQGRYGEALSYYEKSAFQGYAPSQWCYGIDTFYGTGVAKDEAKGLHYIKMSAEQHYEFAIEFLIRSYKESTAGLDNHAEEVQKWETILKQVKSNRRQPF